MQVNWQGTRQEVYLYLLLEFQSTVDGTMPIRLMHYVACFYDHLLKNQTTTPGRGLPPVFLRPYQPHLRYYLVDEGAYSEADLARRHSALSGVFELEQAAGREALQAAVSRIVERDPAKDRLDKVITRWLKRHFARIQADVDISQINSLVENQGMLAENLQHWAEKERLEGRLEGRMEGRVEGRMEGLLEARRQTARNLITHTEMADTMIAEIAGLSTEEVAELRAETKH